MRNPDFAGFVQPGSPTARLVARIDMDRRPRHVAVIMDGNGRWASRRRLSRVFGHRAGVESVRDTVEAAARLGIDVLTLYAFSVENWRRPADEVSTLMKLLRDYVRKELPTLQRNDVRFRPIGRLGDLPEAVRTDLDHAVTATAGNGGLLFQIALSYGGRAEITDAARALVRSWSKEGLDAADITEEVFARHLYTAGLPDPDLLIRTGGEMRVSNFLLWQIAYAEIHVTPVLWPDFRRDEFYEAVLEFQSRERRFGGVDSVPAGREG